MKFNLDIVIPVYNSANQLFFTLCSLGQTPVNFINKILIIDDGSTKNNNYQEVIKNFKEVYNIEFFKLEKNSGPSFARNKGILLSKAEYIMFIDCGDIICNPLIFKYLNETVENNLQINIFSFGHDSENQGYIPPSHNRIMGKIYKRNFLISHNIIFGEEAPKVNEDIGFNIACRLICPDEKYLEINESLILWVYESSSLSRKNNHEFYYHQVDGLAKNGIHAINLAKKNHVLENIIQKEAYSIFSWIYIYYVSSLNIHPEFEKENFLGALYFYNNYFTVEKQIDVELFIKTYYEEIRNLTSDLSEPFFMKISNFSIIDFLNLLEQFSKGENNNVQN